jgi:hypothetical protein
MIVPIYAKVSTNGAEMMTGMKIEQELAHPPHYLLAPPMWVTYLLLAIPLFKLASLAITVARAWDFKEAREGCSTIKISSSFDSL